MATFWCSARNLASLLFCQVVASRPAALTKAQWITASAPRKCPRYSSRSGLVRSAITIPGKLLPSRVVARTSIGTRSHRPASSLNIRWAMYPAAPVSTTRRLAIGVLLQLDGLHLRFGIARAGRRPGRHGLVDPLAVARVELGRERARVLLEVLPPLRAGDGDDVVPLSQEPGEDELAGFHALLLGDLLDPMDEREVVLEVPVLEARMLTAPVIRGEVAEVLDPSRQEAAAEGRVGDEGDAELPTGGQGLLRRVPVEKRVLALHRAQAVDGMGPPDGRGRRLGEAEVAHLALLDEPGHGPHRIRDGDLRVHTVLVVEIDDIDAQPLETRVAGAADIRGTAVDEIALAIRALDLAELRGEHRLVAPTLERPAQQLLVVSPTVHVRGVQEVDPQVQRVVDDVDGLGVVALAVGAGHGHAPEPDGRDLQVAVPQLAILHGGRSPVLNSTGSPHHSGRRRRRAPDQLAAAGRRLPDPPREGRHRLQQVLEAAGAHEEDLGVGGDHGDVGLPGPALEQPELAEDVALAHLADEPALDPDREVTGEQDVEAVGLVAMDDDVLAALERLDLAEDREARELARGHVLDDTARSRPGLRLEPRPLLRQLQPRQQAPYPT